MAVHILRGRGWEALDGLGVGERIGFWFGWRRERAGGGENERCGCWGIYRGGGEDMGAKASLVALVGVSVMVSNLGDIGDESLTLSSGLTLSSAWEMESRGWLGGDTNRDYYLLRKQLSLFEDEYVPFYAVSSSPTPKSAIHSIFSEFQYNIQRARG